MVAKVVACLSPSRRSANKCGGGGKAAGGRLRSLFYFYSIFTCGDKAPHSHSQPKRETGGDYGLGTSRNEGCVVVKVLLVYYYTELRTDYLYSMPQK